MHHSALPHPRDNITKRRTRSLRWCSSSHIPVICSNAHMSIDIGSCVHIPSGRLTMIRAKEKQETGKVKERAQIDEPQRTGGVHKQAPAFQRHVYAHFFPTKTKNEGCSVLRRKIKKPRRKPFNNPNWEFLRFRPHLWRYRHYSLLGTKLVPMSVRNSPPRKRETFRASEGFRGRKKGGWYRASVLNESKDLLPCLRTHKTHIVVCLPLPLPCPSFSPLIPFPKTKDTLLTFSSAACQTKTKNKNP